MPFGRDTDAIVAGRDTNGSLVNPLTPSTTWESNNLAEMAAKATGMRAGGLYSRYSNPTVRSFEEAMAVLEGAESSLAFASGMGAIASTILAFCSNGDHIVAQKQLYGGTRTFLEAACPRFGIDVTFVDGTSPSAFAEAVRPGKTMLVIAEIPSNPMLDIVDLAALTQIKGPFKLVDSTVATPVALRPIEHGIDLVVHSATKGIAGHNDATLGVVSGESELIDAIWAYSVVHGAAPSPYDAHNALRGIRTLPLRTKHQSATALTLARQLESHPAISHVRYLGCESHPQHELAKTMLDQSCTILSFELKDGLAAATKTMDSLKLIRLATSFGGPETLICHPATSTHAGTDPSELAAAGVSPGLLRLSVGLEDPEDLWADLSSTF